MKTTEYYRRKTEWIAQLVLSLGFMIGGIVLSMKHPDLNLPREVKQFAPTAVLVLEGLGLLGVVWAAIFLMDSSPKLVIDEVGITDYRSRKGPRLIGWDTIHSMDYEITTMNGSVQKARINIYRVTEEEEIEEVKVNVAGLNVSAKKVISQVKKDWIQFNYRQGVELEREE